MGINFSAVLVTVKGESFADIPRHLNLKNHCSDDTIGHVHIIDYEDLGGGSDQPSDPSDHGLSPIPEVFSSDEDMVEIEGGTGYADVLQALGVPPPAIPMCGASPLLLLCWLSVPLPPLLPSLLCLVIPSTPSL